MDTGRPDLHRLVVALTTGIVVVATMASAGGASEFPTLLPGGTAVVP